MMIFRFNLLPLLPRLSQGSPGQTMPASDGSTVGEEIRTACLASGAAGAAPPSADVATRLTPKAENELVTQISTLVTTLKPTETTKSTSVNHLSMSASSVKTRPGAAALKCQTSCPEPVCRPDGGAVLDHGTLEEAAVEPDGGQQAAGVYRFLSQGGSWSRSASLPRGFRRSEGSSRLSSAITARPFGAMQPRVSSLPKLCNVSFFLFPQRFAGFVKRVTPTVRILITSSAWNVCVVPPTTRWWSEKKPDYIQWLHQIPTLFRRDRISLFSDFILFIWQMNSAHIKKKQQMTTTKNKNRLFRTLV